jgi:chemotaxis protein MotB
MKKKAPEGVKENKERWLLTYADLITLLMIFFVVMYALSSVEQKKFQALAGSLRFVFGGGGNLIGQYPGSNVIPTPTESETGLDVLLDSVEKHLAEQGPQTGSNTAKDDRGLVITLQEKTTFEPGQADLSGKARSQLLVLAKIINSVDNDIRVEGHTDNVPIRSSQYKSNWQLSSVRAANIVDFLVREGGVAPQRISAAAYAEFHPLADNRTLAGRNKNRRVEIILLNRHSERAPR